MSHFSHGHRLQLLVSGDDYFPALLADIAAARQEIFLESYIFANDRIGQAVAAALADAARRGVPTYLMVDGFGARHFANDFLPALQAAGVHVLIHRPERHPWRLRRHRLRRLHRKLAVIDGRIGFVGGINIVDDDNAPPGMAPRFDYAVRVEGPAVCQMREASRHLYALLARTFFRRRAAPLPLPAEACPLAGDQRATFLIRDNFRHRQDILNAYLEAIAGAREEILIANAYFLPGLRFGRALQAAAARGVRVSILLQGKTDHPLLRYATQAMYAQVQAWGVRIYEYEKSFLHAKVAVIDGHWATVGSSNIDPFSLLLAREANLVVDDRAFAGELRHSLLTAIAEGAREQVTAGPAGSPGQRLLRWLSYGLVRLLVGIAGYGPAHVQDTQGGRD